jgi:large repetitive protein
MNGWARNAKRILGSAVAAAVVVMALPHVAEAVGPTDPISVSDVSVTEGNAGTVNAAFTISYTGPGNALTVNYATANGTAAAPTDYTAKSGTASLPSSGCKCTTVNVVVKGDTLFEANETFTLNLSAPSSPGVISDGQGVGTITNDDAAPALSVTDATTLEGDAGSTNATFTVSLSAVSYLGTTVAYATADDTATAGSDYTTTSGTLSIPAGQLSGTVVVPVLGDVVDEADETYFLNLSSPTNATIADGQGVGTITDDDVAVAISVDDVSGGEGDSGTVTQTFTVSLDVPSGKTVSVDYVTTDGSADAATDYQSTTGTLTYLPGETTKTVDVLVNGDTLSEDDETYTLDLSNPVRSTIADAQGVGTILDDDPQPVIGIDDPVVNEAGGTATFTVTLSAASGRTVTVDYQTADGSATDGSDYMAATGTVTFAPGETQQTVDVPILDDATYEADETFTLELSNEAGASLPDTSGGATISNDDAAPALSVNDRSTLEGDSGTSTTTFTVSLDQVSEVAVTVDYTTSNNTAVAASDYVATSGTLTFDPGVTQQTVDVTVNGDTTLESDETFFLDLANATDATITDGHAIGTILNDDGTPDVVVADATKVEGNTGTSPMTFVLTLSHPTAGVVSVDYATSDLLATAGSDYDAASGTVTFQPGIDTATVNVPVKGDVAYEDAETFAFTLSNASGVAIADGAAVGTITNDDKLPTSLTVKVVKTKTRISAKGLLNAAEAGDQVTAILYKQKGGKYVKTGTRTVTVGTLGDQNADGFADATYTALFKRPAHGNYRFKVTFAGSATQKSCSVTKNFKL